MRNLNPVGREADVLHLIDKDGEKFTVEVNEQLVNLLKTSSRPSGNESQQLSPRQIQDAIRNGSTVDELVSSGAASRQIIESFAYPVLEELEHILDLAKSVRIEMPADRFNDVHKIPFGDVVESKLKDSGITKILWSAKRDESISWTINVTYQANGTEGVGVWSFDPRRYLLTPENSTAQSLSNPTAKFDTPLGTVQKTVVLTQPTHEDTVVSEDKLQAFRRRREVEVPQITPPPTPVIEVVEEIIAIVEDLEPEVVVLEETKTEEVESIQPTASKKARAPMPTWDQIVRGTQSDDDSAF